MVLNHDVLSKRWAKYVIKSMHAKHMPSKIPILNFPSRKHFNSHGVPHSRVIRCVYSIHERFGTPPHNHLTDQVGAPNRFITPIVLGKTQGFSDQTAIGLRLRQTSYSAPNKLSWRSQVPPSKPLLCDPRERPSLR